MFTVIATIVVVVLVFVLTFKLCIRSCCGFEDYVFGSIAGIAAAVVLGFATFGLLGSLLGVNDDYEVGIFEGNIVSVSLKGVIWPTYEIELTVGQTNKDFILRNISTPDPILAGDLYDNIGKNVRIEYRQWFMSPWSVGSQNKEVIEIVPIDPTK